MPKLDEEAFCQETWLNYFNKYLFEYGVITQKEYKQMQEKILSHVAKIETRNRAKNKKDQS